MDDDQMLRSMAPLIGPDGNLTQLARLFAYAVAAVERSKAKREADRLRAAIERVCASYPDDDAAPTCVAVLRQALRGEA